MHQCSRILKDTELINYLNTVVDKPLQCGECTNHDNPGSKTSPHAFETKILGGGTNGCTLGFVHVGDDGVGTVRHNGAKHWKAKEGECLGCKSLFRTNSVFWCA